MPFRRNYRKKPMRRFTRRTVKPKVSKPLRAAIKQVIKKSVETKTINVPDPEQSTLLSPKNTIAKLYPAAGGLQYLAHDVFKCAQGVEDDTRLGAPNRIGDKVRGIGFLMNYYFHLQNTYVDIANNRRVVPFVKLRVIAFRQAFGVAVPIYSQLYNTDFCNVASFTIHPVSLNQGFAREVLYDRVFMLKPNDLVTSDSVSNPNVQQNYSNVMHFRKYIKFDNPIKFMDDNSSNPSGTDKPIYIAISAEIDDSVSGLPQSGVTLLTTTGYTQAWFKDA